MKKKGTDVEITLDYPFNPEKNISGKMAAV
jgi:hypothetical protein